MIQQIPLTQIVADNTLQVRCKLDQAHVNKLTEIVHAGNLDEKLVVYPLNDGTGRYGLIDGFHTEASLTANGREKATCEVVNVKDAEEAFAIAVRRNSAHGLALNSSDKRKIVEHILRNPRYSALSGDMIAKEFNYAFSRQLVDDVRKEQLKPLNLTQPVSHFATSEHEEPPSAAKEPRATREPGDDSWQEEPEETAKPPQRAVDAGYVDQVGKPIPKYLRGVFDNLQRYMELKAQLREAMSEAMHLGKAPGGTYFHDEDFCNTLRQAVKNIEDQCPYAVCPMCNATDHACKVCNGTFYVDRVRYKQHQTYHQ